MGQDGRSWPEIAATLNGWNFRTARNRRWTGLNTRQYWHHFATHAMKVTRGRAIESKRGVASGYLERMRRRPSPDSEMVI